MEEALDKSFLDIVVSKYYKVYSETKIHIDGKDYLVKIPVENVRAYITAQNKIRYKVEHTTLLEKEVVRKFMLQMMKEDKHLLNVERMDYLTEILVNQESLKTVA